MPKLLVREVPAIPAEPLYEPPSVADLVPLARGRPWPEIHDIAIRLALAHGETELPNDARKNGPLSRQVTALLDGIGADRTACACLSQAFLYLACDDRKRRRLARRFMRRNGAPVPYLPNGEPNLIGTHRVSCAPPRTPESPGLYRAKPGSAGGLAEARGAPAPQAAQAPHDRRG